MSNQENSNKVFPKIFDDIVNYNREQGIMDGAEQNFTKYLERIGVSAIAFKHDGINFNLLRDNKLWWPEDIK